MFFPLRVVIFASKALIYFPLRLSGPVAIYFCYEGAEALMFFPLRLRAFAAIDLLRRL